MKFVIRLDIVALNPNVGVTWSVSVSRNMRGHRRINSISQILNRPCIHAHSHIGGDKKKRFNQFCSLSSFLRADQDQGCQMGYFVYFTRSIIILWCYQFQFTRWKWNCSLSLYHSVNTFVFLRSQIKDGDENDRIHSGVINSFSFSIIGCTLQNGWLMEESCVCHSKWIQLKISKVSYLGLWK